MRRFISRSMIAAVAASALGAWPTSARADFGVNLIANPGAESGTLVATVGGFSTYSTPGWTNLLGNFEAELYSEGVAPNINPASPGPADRGRLLFYGGVAALTIATQSITLATTDLAAIDAGRAGYNLSGYLGGFANQDDNTILSAAFRSGSGALLASSSVGPVLAADRNQISGLLFRSASGAVPVGTRSVDILLTITRVSGSFNNGAADNLNFSLINPNAVPEPAAGALLVAGGLGLLAVRRRRGRDEARA